MHGPCQTNEATTEVAYSPFHTVGLQYFHVQSDIQITVDWSTVFLDLSAALDNCWSCHTAALARIFIQYWCLYTSAVSHIETIGHTTFSSGVSLWWVQLCYTADLSQLIKRHGHSQYLLADDKLIDINLRMRISTWCTDEIDGWMHSKRFQINYSEKRFAIQSSLTVANCTAHDWCLPNFFIHKCSTYMYPPWRWSKSLSHEFNKPWKNASLPQTVAQLSLLTVHLGSSVELSRLDYIDFTLTGLSLP